MNTVSRAVLAAGFAILFSCTGKEKTAEEQKEKPLAPEVVSMIKLVKQYPDSAGLRLRLAVALDSSAHYGEALAQMDSLISRDSLNYGLWYSKAQVWEHSGDTSSAIRDYERALRIYPAPEAQLSLANLFAERRDVKAINICENLNRLKLGREYDAHCAFIEGVYYARTGDTTRAIQQLDKCIANNYTYMEAHIEKGLVYFDHKDYNKALEVFRFASSVNTLYADAYYYQARAYEMMNKKDSALLRFKQALSLDKNLTQAKEKIQQLEK